MSISEEDSPADKGYGQSNCAVAEAVQSALVDRIRERVRPLGHRGGSYWFLTKAGELLKFSQSQLVSLPGLISLYAGDLAFLIEQFPRLNNKGKVIGFSVAHASAPLIAACHKHGLYDERREVRGRGVWANNSGLAIHCGDQVFADGKWAPAGCEIGRAIYPAEPAIPRPAATSASPADVEQVRSVLERWSFRDVGSIELILGFLAQSYLGAAPSWRAHLLVTGSLGVGKSAFGRLVKAMLGHLAVFSNDASPAGLRQLLNGEPRLLILDEVEGNEGQAQGIIDLLRRLSSHDGVTSVRGTSGGTAQNFLLTGSALVMAIRPPRLDAQDRSRITEIELRALSDEAASGDIDSEIQTIARLGPYLWQRMIDGYPRYIESKTLIRNYLVSVALGSRAADQLGGLLAGYWTIIQDELVSVEVLEHELARYAWATPQPREQSDESPPMLCLNCLLASFADGQHVNERKTIGELIAEAIEKPTNSQHLLKANGVRIVADYHERGPHLLVANQSPQLERLFATTMWANGRWAQDLKRLPGVGPSASSERFGLSLSRATVIPAALLLPPADGP